MIAEGRVFESRLDGFIDFAFALSDILDIFHLNAYRIFIWNLNLELLEVLQKKQAVVTKFVRELVKNILDFGQGSSIVNNLALLRLLRSPQRKSHNGSIELLATTVWGEGVEGGQMVDHAWLVRTRDDIIRVSTATIRPTLVWIEKQESVSRQDHRIVGPVVNAVEATAMSTGSRAIILLHAFPDSLQVIEIDLPEFGVVEELEGGSLTIDEDWIDKVVRTIRIIVKDAALSLLSNIFL